MIRVNYITNSTYVLNSEMKGVEKPLFVFVKALKGLKNPMRVISNVNNEKNIERYLKRWEIERIFKTWKQKFDFEKVGT